MDVPYAGDGMVRMEKTYTHELTWYKISGLFLKRYDAGRFFLW